MVYVSRTNLKFGMYNNCTERSTSTLEYSLRTATGIQCSTNQSMASGKLKFKMQFHSIPEEGLREVKPKGGGGGETKPWRLENSIQDVTEERPLNNNLRFKNS